MASEPEDPLHRHRTVHRLIELIEGSQQIEPGFPESVRPDFVEHRAHFLDSLRPHLGRPGGDGSH